MSKAMELVNEMRRKKRGISKPMEPVEEMDFLSDEEDDSAMLVDNEDFLSDEMKKPLLSSILESIRYKRAKK